MDFFFLLTEKVTKYCDELGNWIQTGSTCQPSSKNKFEVFGCFPVSNGRITITFALHTNLYVDLFCFFIQMEVLHFLRDAAGEPTTEAIGINTEKGSVMAIVVNEKTCAEKIKQDPPYNKSGTHTVY